MEKGRFILTGTLWLGLLAPFVTSKLQAADYLNFKQSNGQTTVIIDFNKLPQAQQNGEAYAQFQTNQTLFNNILGWDVCTLKLKSASPNPQGVLIPAPFTQKLTPQYFQYGHRIMFSTTRTFASTLTTDLVIKCIYEIGTATGTVTLIIKKIGSAPTPVTPPTGFKPGDVRVSVIVHYSGALGININCVPGSTFFPPYRRTSRADRLWLRMGNRR